MSSTVQDKVALITGGAGGIGLAFAQELLRNGAKGVVLVDINGNLLQSAKEQTAKKFGSHKVDFIKVDVADKNQLEAAFKKAIQTFNQLDIVINNAGIADDFNYEKEIQTNCIGVVHGTLLAVHDYLPKYRNGIEGYVVNVSSACCLYPSSGLPIYSATKFFVTGFSRAMGSHDHYEKTKVKIFTICPGLTDTNIIKTCKCLGPDYMNLFLKYKDEFQEQDPSHLGKELIGILNNAASGTVWSIENRKPAREIVN